MGNEKLEKSIVLTVPDDVRRVIAERRIFPEDVRKVIFHAENTDQKMLVQENQHLISHLEIGPITCWVEYSALDEGFILHNAYFHRIQIEE